MIWLIGNKGMLGTELSLLLDEAGIQYTGTDRECDIRDIAALRDYAKGKRIDWIVNCSAYTAVDKAEEEEEFARSINALGAGNIAKVATELGARMLHVSTDYVFDGEGIAGAKGELRPYREDDIGRPVGAYGRTKLEGEELVRANCPGCLILRTAWLYGQYGQNFVQTMLRLMKSKDSIGVVNDQRGNPTWANDLSRAILFLVRDAKDALGIYHFTNSGITNWYEFACEIQALGLKSGLLEKPCAVKAITTAEYPTKTRRPAWSALSKDRIESLGFVVPGWKESLARFIESVAKKEMIDNGKEAR